MVYTEQEVMHNIKSVIGAKAVPESHLQFAPRRVIDKFIAKEKPNCEDAKAEIQPKHLPCQAKLISSQSNSTDKPTILRSSFDSSYTAIET